MIESPLLEELERFSDALHASGLSPPYPPLRRLSFTHISLLTEVLTVIHLAVIFHNTVHLFELSNGSNENTITV